jgi:hypothetical protein
MWQEVQRLLGPSSSPAVRLAFGIALALHTALVVGLILCVHLWPWSEPKQAEGSRWWRLMRSGLGLTGAFPWALCTVAAGVGIPRIWQGEALGFLGVFAVVFPVSWLGLARPIGAWWPRMTELRAPAVLMGALVLSFFFASAMLGAHYFPAVEGAIVAAVLAVPVGVAAWSVDVCHPVSAPEVSEKGVG